MLTNIAENDHFWRYSRYKGNLALLECSSYGGRASDKTDTPSLSPQATIVTCRNSDTSSPSAWRAGVNCSSSSTLLLVLLRSTTYMNLYMIICAEGTHLERSHYLARMTLFVTHWSREYRDRSQGPRYLPKRHLELRQRLLPSRKTVVYKSKLCTGTPQLILDCALVRWYIRARHGWGAIPGSDGRIDSGCT